MSASDARATVIGLLLAAWWMAGVALAKGFISTTCAFFIPPWGMYLVIEKLVEKFL